MVYGPNGKDITAPMEYTLMVYTLMGLWKIVFRCGNRHGKRWKDTQYKRYKFNQSYFYNFHALHKVDESDIISNFREIWNGLYFLPFPVSTGLSTINRKQILRRTFIFCVNKKWESEKLKVRAFYFLLQDL